MSEKVYQFAIPRGKRKGQICGKHCQASEGSEPLCHRHEDTYMSKAREKQKEKYGKGNIYITKNQRMAKLDELTMQQINQIGMLSEDFLQTKVNLNELREELAKQRKANEVTTKRVEELEKRIQPQDCEISQCKKIHCGIFHKLKKLEL